MNGGFTPSLKTTPSAVTAEASVLASEHGMVKRVGVTIDATTVGADADANKVLKTGTILAKITATGKYAAYDNALADGREDAQGILLESVNLRDGDVITGVLLHGSVLEARVSGLDSGARTDLAGRIIFQ